MRKLMTGVAIVFALTMLWSCKPTEKNYKAAYDAAVSKREKADADIEIPAGGLQSLDGPRRMPVDGDTVYYQHERLRMPEGDTRVIPRFNVAVAVYKMSTNAASMVENLKKKYPDAYYAREADEKWWVVVAGFSSISDAVKFLRTYEKKNPNMHYIGLPGSPVLLEASTR